jgi:prolipoprotein diacylglyceryltransferase
LFYLYIGGYCSYRFIIEGIRIDDAHVIGGLRLNQWVSLVIGGAGLTKFFRQIR